MTKRAGRRWHLNLAANDISLSEILTGKRWRTPCWCTRLRRFTNLLLHIPAIAHAAGAAPAHGGGLAAYQPSDAPAGGRLPNGPRNHPTVQVFMAGGVPEVMLHLREMGLLHLDVLTAAAGHWTRCWTGGPTANDATQRARLSAAGQIDPDHVIMDADTARRPDSPARWSFPWATSRPRVRSSRRRPLTQRGGCGQRLPPSRPGPGLHQRGCGHRGHQGTGRHAGRSRATCWWS
ncbi:MAG: hypothetical protein R2838_25160 [Caldilineaceae bacterium]